MNSAPMQELAEGLFQMPMEITICQEEAAYGAALQALHLTFIPDRIMVVWKAEYHK